MRERANCLMSAPENKVYKFLGTHKKFQENTKKK